MGRFHGLDALRGIAAVMVMLHHFGPRLAGISLLPAGYLCVDFFFVLSGFIIERAYRQRFAQGLSTIDFTLARLVRLYPVMAFGILAGAAVAALQGMGRAELLVRYVAQMLFIPLDGRYHGIYQLNGVQWSLTFEIFANLMHALILWRLSKRQLAVVIAAAFFFLATAAFVYGFAAVGDRTYNFWWGVPRVLFSYSLGVMLCRLSIEQQLPPIRVPAPIIGTAIIGAMIVTGAVPHGPTRALLDLLVICTFPVIVTAALSRRFISDRAAGLLGSISYPLYAVHLPALALVEILPLTNSALRLGLAVLIALTAAAGLNLILGNLLPRRAQPGLKTEDA